MPTQEQNSLYLQQLEARLRQQELENAQRPEAPTWRSLIGDDGYLNRQYKLQGPESLTDYASGLYGNLKLNTQGLEELRKRGLATGPSAWAQLEGQKQDLAKQQQLEDLMSSSAGGAASAWNQLAATGGAGAGERERLALNASRGLMEGKQKLNQADRAARLGISSQDETNKLGILSNLPGQEVQALQPEMAKFSALTAAKSSDIGNQMDVNKFNTANLIAERDKQGAFDLGRYNEAMRSWAAGKTADATASAGKK